MVLNRSGHPYKPSAVRAYKHELHEYVLPDLGGLRLSDVRRADLQALVDRLVGQGLSGSKVRNIVISAGVLPLKGAGARCSYIVTGEMSSGGGVGIARFALR